MDIARTGIFPQSRRRIFTTMAVIAVLAVAAFAISRIPPAAPVVTRSAVWTGKVTRGPMLREVRGTGILTPLEIRWIPAPHQGRVERVAVQPGARVEASTVLLELSNPEITQSAMDADLAVRAAEAELASKRVDIESSVLAQQAAAATVSSGAEEAERRLRVEEDLASQGLTSNLTLELARTRAREMSTRRVIEDRRVEIARKSAGAQLAMHESRVDQLRTLATLRTSQRDSLTVRAGIDGILQQVPVEVGQQVAAGSVLAKVAQPERLKAELRIAETQARDIQIGQSVSIDTRNGIVEGSVMRVHPAVENGTVRVDVALPQVLPRGARPDLTVDGTIQLERLPDVVHAPRPMLAESNTTITLFRLVDGGSEAERVRVRVGRVSANAIEILGGVRPGDEVILSDVSAWSNHDRIRLQ
jgi:HlyD family secretion protein